jgi:hypothetical protein
VSALAGETFDEARRKLELLEEADRERVARESALNELQAFVFDLQDKIYQVKILFSLSPTIVVRKKNDYEIFWFDKDHSGSVVI